MSYVDDRTYRVEIAFDTKTVAVQCFGTDSVDTELKSDYKSVGALPTWVQERLAALAMLPVPPPPNDVEGVGCRIGPYLYWVVK